MRLSSLLSLLSLSQGEACRGDISLLSRMHKGVLQSLSRLSSLLHSDRSGKSGKSQQPFGFRLSVRAGAHSLHRFEK